MKKVVLTSITLILVLVSCKKKDNSQETSETAPPTSTPTYSVFSSTIAVVDYTASATSSWTLYSSNLPSSVVAMAYIVADSVRIDSLGLKITRVPDMLAPPSVTWHPSPCDKEIFYQYEISTKEFKVNPGSSNKLEIYEDGKLIASQPIILYKTYVSYDHTNGFTTNNPKTYATECADGQKFIVIQ